MLKHKPKAVHFGAGNIGRGFIGLLLSQSNYEVCFISRNEEQINLLQRHRSYNVHLAGPEGGQMTVRNVTAVSSSSETEVAEQVAGADLVTTAVGAGNLQHVAGAIAKGLARRLQNSPKPLNIIACENGIGSSTKLRRYVYEHLQSGLHPEADRLIAFPNAAVDRIVPAQKHDNPLEITVEPYCEWAIDRTAVASGETPPINGAKFVDALDAYVERKLFTVNTAHCCAAYYGYLAGYSTIQEAMSDPDIRSKVRKVMQETGQMLIEKHNLDEARHHKYIGKIMERFTNPGLRDNVIRVGRSPLRKLSAEERLVRPALQAHELGRETPFLVSAIAAALAFNYDQDSEAVKLQQAIREHGIGRVIADHLGISPLHPLHRRIAASYQLMNQTMRSRSNERLGGVMGE